MLTTAHCKALWKDDIHRSLVMTDNGTSGSTSFTCCTMRATRESSAPALVPRNPCATVRGLAPKSDKNIVSCYTRTQNTSTILIQFSNFMYRYTIISFLTIESVLTWKCSLRGNVSFPFDVFGFVCFSDLCGDHAQLGGQQLTERHNGHYIKRHNETRQSFEMDKK